MVHSIISSFFSVKGCSLQLQVGQDKQSLTMFLLISLLFFKNHSDTIPYMKKMAVISKSVIVEVIEYDIRATLDAIIKGHRGCTISKSKSNW